MVQLCPPAAGCQWICAPLAWRQTGNPHRPTGPGAQSSAATSSAACGCPAVHPSVEARSSCSNPYAKAASLSLSLSLSLVLTARTALTGDQAAVHAPNATTSMPGISAHPGEGPRGSDALYMKLRERGEERRERRKSGASGATLLCLRGSAPSLLVVHPPPLIPSRAVGWKTGGRAEPTARKARRVVERRRVGERVVTRGTRNGGHARGPSSLPRDEELTAARRGCAWESCTPNTSCRRRRPTNNRRSTREHSVSRVRGVFPPANNGALAVSSCERT